MVAMTPHMIVPFPLPVRLCWSRLYGRSSPTKAAARTSVEWPDEWAEAPNHQMKGALLLWENVLHANFIIAINYIIAGSREND